MGLSRKLKRKQQGIFMKEFKKKMKEFKKIVKCSNCGKAPTENENIDDWKINKSSEDLDLLCLDCFRPADEEIVIQNED